MNRVRAGDPIQLNDLANIFSRAPQSKYACFALAKTSRETTLSFRSPEEGTIRYGIFLEREVTVVFTTPRTSRSFGLGPQDFACRLPLGVASLTPAKQLNLAAGERIERS
jgi:hypothetical protein